MTLYHLVVIALALVYGIIAAWISFLLEDLTRPGGALNLSLPPMTRYDRLWALIFLGSFWIVFVPLMLISASARSVSSKINDHSHAQNSGSKSGH